jgi:hypothetical protein
MIDFPMILKMIGNLPVSVELAESAIDLSTDPKLVRFNNALTAFQTAMGATPSAPTQAVEDPAQHIGGHPSGTDPGRI